VEATEVEGRWEKAEGWGWRKAAGKSQRIETAQVPESC
jgi:hypothetical protein